MDLFGQKVRDSKKLFRWVQFHVKVGSCSAYWVKHLESSLAVDRQQNPQDKHTQGAQGIAHDAASAKSGVEAIGVALECCHFEAMELRKNIGH